MTVKKIAAVIGLLCLSACAPTQDNIYRQPISADIPLAYEPTKADAASAKIAMLLPLSGKSSSVGEEMKRAGMMAQYDKQSSNTAVIFYDTQGTPEGAEAALEAALKQKPTFVVGPVFAAETEAVREEGSRVPVVAFTSDNEVVGDDVYSIALMIPAQVERVVDYACQQGQRKIAVLGPENRVGEITMNTLSKAVQTCPDMVIQNVSLYNPRTVNFDPAVAKLVPQPIDPKKKDLTDEEKLMLETPIAERVDFDSLLVFEDGVKLQQVMSMLSYYDVTPKDIPIYGLSSWSNVRDANLIGGYYPAMPNALYADFIGRYRRHFGETPSRMAAYAYDAVSLGTLSGNAHFSDAVLTNENGFSGVNGRFRLNSDGTNTRLLDMMQVVSKNRAAVVQSAPNQMPLRNKTSFFGEKQPQINEMKNDYNALIIQ